ncbi:hypothetical protein CLOSTHATH_00273 [Hungatella hathewayi DSM 13479]|uniref:Uncharacterized protein n=1 Tax=Hungatella hathewayi DSM 13479 TaxID=566550 RepID=D3A9K2_9FIRM|nr:hypothetical protein CLOSTHATH_00273 [Hungatella hathewayi DSM 13479]
MALDAITNVQELYTKHFIFFMEALETEMNGCTFLTCVVSSILMVWR